MTDLGDKWNERFMELAKQVASWSKDPSTQVGAVIVRPDKTIASVGFNGFPRGVCDHKERYETRKKKYTLVVHAEQNAIFSAKEDLSNCTLYVTLHPCNQCMKAIIQSGIKTVYFDAYTPAHMNHSIDWKSALKWSMVMAEEAGVALRSLE